MPRVIWKGAISFGLVNVPVALYPASQEIGIDFDWLDKRSMDPVGYKRVNKRTGKEIERDDIVKGIKQADGEYVVLSEEEIKAAYPVSTQTIEIETFVAANEIPFTYLEKPYYLAPVGKAREGLCASARRDGRGRRDRHRPRRDAHQGAPGRADPRRRRAAAQHDPLGRGDPAARRDRLPAAGKSAAKPKEGEMKMAQQLIKDMTGTWKPSDYTDKFTNAIHALAAQRVKAGKTEKVTSLEGEAAPATAATWSISPNC